MTAHIYAVIDADGTVLNRIAIDYPPNPNYWPGYGHKLVDLGEAPPENQSKPPPNKDPEFGVAEFVVSEPVDIGDKIDPKTGVVTKKPAPVDEVGEIVVP